MQSCISLFTGSNFQARSQEQDHESSDFDQMSEYDDSSSGSENGTTDMPYHEKYIKTNLLTRSGRASRRPKNLGDYIL